MRRKIMNAMSHPEWRDSSPCGLGMTGHSEMLPLRYALGQHDNCCHSERSSCHPERSEGSHHTLWIHVVLIAILFSGCATSRLNKKGDEAAGEGKYEEAIRFYEESLQKDPDQEETRTKLTETKRTYSVIVWGQANEFFMTGEVREGLARAKKAMGLDPQNTDYKDQFEQKLQEQKRDGDENYKRNKFHEAFEAFDAYL